MTRRKKVSRVLEKFPKTNAAAPPQPKPSPCNNSRWLLPLRPMAKSPNPPTASGKTR